ncbi:hypothetical protein Pcinc_029596 [Petrolisthes cinctipes]|uniref:AN1-type domain-containing protein n=1 Tax=Petrolisthes cinctipes TaxID=88211 RepID=A0AAE1F0I5_PETCI|nr:hypothetical protein Pcinc_029596 [Petrolisthes cinctipes]
MDSQVQLDGRLLSLVDSAWRQDRLPSEDVAVPATTPPIDCVWKSLQNTHTQERMEFPDLGQQCQVSSCSQLDFLPIKCHFCGESYCQYHFLPQQHKCIGENHQTRTTEVPESPGERVCGKKYLCEVKGCRGGELAPVICPACTHNFCLAHRHQVDHECSSYQPSENPMSQAAIKIQEITNRLDAADSKKGQGRKSDKLAAKVQLMKLKQRSSGKSGLTQEERLYFLVMLPKGSPTTSLPVFVSHHWVVGVAVDNIASLAKLPNRNNVVGADKLVLFRTSDGSQVVPIHSTLKSLVEEQELYNGQSLILEYVTKNTSSLTNHKDYKV